MENALIRLTPSKAREQWVCYTHHSLPTETTPPILLYVNACQLGSLFNMTEPQRNSEWARYVPPGAEIVVRIELIGTLTEARGKQRQILDAMRPICNMRGHDMAGNSVIRSSAGHEWATQAAAAEALQTTQSQISKVLNGKPGYNTIRGLTIWRENRVR